MLTDVGEVFLKIIRERHPKARIALVHARDYYPWRISFKLLNLTVTLRSEVLDDSNWQSFIEFKPQKIVNSRGRKEYIALLKLFVRRLGRNPCISMYWSEGNWNRLYRTTDLDERKIKRMWDFKKM